MSIRHMSIGCALLVVSLVLFTACTPSPQTAGTVPTQTVSATTHALPSPTATAVPPTPVQPTPTKSPTSRPLPTSYTAQTVIRGVGRPDDLAFDLQGRLLFSDEINGTISRVNADGSVTVLLRDPAGPEGLVVLQDSTIIFAEQETNRIVSLAPGTTTPTILRTLPGIASTATCKNGVDGIALDPTTNTLIIPDSPTGVVYRMSLDGKTLTFLASGIVRPVGAGVDSNGNVFIADECGNAVWRITPGGARTRIGGFGMPDDVIPDGYGNLLVIDLEPSIHALIRFNPVTGQRQVLASRSFIEPQGVIMDTHGNIFVSDDYANIIIKYIPA